MYYIPEILLALFPFIMFYTIVGIAGISSKDTEVEINTKKIETKTDKTSLWTILQQ